MEGRYHIRGHLFGVREAIAGIDDNGYTGWELQFTCVSICWHGGGYSRVLGETTNERTGCVSPRYFLFRPRDLSVALDLAEAERFVEHFWAKYSVREAWWFAHGMHLVSVFEGGSMPKTSACGHHSEL